jgi:hypothetical protein
MKWHAEMFLWRGLSSLNAVWEADVCTLLAAKVKKSSHVFFCYGFWTA